MLSFLAVGFPSAAAAEGFLATERDGRGFLLASLTILFSFILFLCA